jgi:hypothetical protein
MTNKKLRDNLTAKQKDYAVFLPALSSFYSSDVSKQRLNPNHISSKRIPADFENGIEGLNWLNDQEGYFTYKWSLYSAGHAALDVNAPPNRDDMVRNRDRSNTFILGDSGGFQIGKGVWEGDWKDPNCPKAGQKRKQVLEWLDAYMDRGMILDIPAWVARSPAGQRATGVTTYQEAVNATMINNDYFMRNRNGNCKFLNVLQGENHTEADDWYEQMKKFCDPKQYSQPFEGWAMGGQNMCDVHLMLKRVVALRFDGLLEPGQHDWMHFLGTSKLEWALLLTDVQRAVRKYHNENFTISFDCASPFLATANGQIYTEVETEHGKKWVYRMQPSVDDKKYANDTRPFTQAVLNDRVFESFLDSPISSRLKINDVCYYKPGDLNKIGREGRTSWDSFSYTLQMAHNVWTHIYAVQEANRQCDSGKYPEMLFASLYDNKKMRQYNRQYFRQVVDDIFSTSDRGRAEATIEEYNRYWMSIIGTRGYTGKNTLNSNTNFNSLFDFDEPTVILDENGLNVDLLEQLESDLNDNS